MAHFYGGVQGNRGEATRLGSKDSGMEAFVNGWETGVRVNAYSDDDGDVFQIIMTGGSGGYGPNTFLGTIRQTPDGPVWEPAKND